MNFLHHLPNAHEQEHVSIVTKETFTRILGVGLGEEGTSIYLMSANPYFKKNESF